MRIAFMGTPEFAAKSLRRLYADGFDITGVFTRPDKPRGRGMSVSSCPVKDLAQENGTPVFQPVSLKDGEAAGILRDLNCEMIAIVAYGRLLPREIIGLPVFGCLNIHASLLPKYRGAAPVQHAVLNGDRETGVTSMYVADELDTGDIIFSKTTQIGDDETAGELSDRLGLLGAELLSETVAAKMSGCAARFPQDHSIATFAPPLSKDLSPIDWTDTAYMIKAKVRGLNPWPVATMMLRGVAVKVFAVDFSIGQTGKAPGEIVCAGERGLEIACADGTVCIREMQAPGGKRMSPCDYLRGHAL